MRLRRLNLKIETIKKILIVLLGFLIMYQVSFASNKSVIIKEVMYNPKGFDNKIGKKESYEWIKIKNNSNKDINISNWEIRLDKYYKPFQYIGDLKPNEEKIFYLGADLNNDDINGIYLNKENSVLGDSCGEIVLYNGGRNENFIVDYLLYANSFDQKKLSTSYKHAILAKIWDENCFLENNLEGDSLMVENNKCTINELKEDKKEEIFSKYLKTIRINEILPSPVGKDEEGEFIELYNFGEKDINLGEDNGWVIEDRIGSKKGDYIQNKYKKLIIKNETIRANSFIVLKRTKNFDFALSNDDEIILKTPDGAEVDKIEYSDAKEGISYSYHKEIKKWLWSEFLTPGDKNKFNKTEKIKTKIDKNIYKDVFAEFEVSIVGVKDKKIKVKWDFGDGKKSYLAKTRHKYNRTGEYLLSLVVFNGIEDVKKEFNIKVTNFPQKKISILSINPNPLGSDVDKEWIELKNKSKKTINLNSWSIATGSEKKKLTNHPIYNDFLINPGKTRRITKEFSKFSLGNKKGYIELRYPDGEVAYDLKYKKENGIKDDEIYIKTDSGEWKWFLNEELKKDVDIKNINEVVDDISVNTTDIELIRDILPEEVGVISQEVVDDSILLEGLNNKNILGAWDDKIKINKVKKIREIDGYYYFNPQTKKENNKILNLFKNILIRL